MAGRRISLAETLQTGLAAYGAGEVLRWYACYTRSRHEKIVDRQLRERGYGSFLPLVPRESQWKDRRKTVEWPLFPSYVFGRFPLSEAHNVLSIPGVATLVKSNGQPVPVGDAELENVRRFARALRSQAVELERTAVFAEGDWVRVRSGPLEGVLGVVVQQRGRRRVRIGLEAIGQAFEVNIGTMMLEPVSPP
jgi:transcription antitermination factor NusG